MERFNRYLHVMAAITVVGVLLLAGQRPATSRDPDRKQPPIPVRVDNGSDNPVPVHIGNIPRVCLDPACPPLVHNVDHSAKTAFQRRLEVISDGVFGGTSFTVPAGVRWVIEHVSADAFVPPAEAASMVMITSVDGVAVQHRVVFEGVANYPEIPASPGSFGQAAQRELTASHGMRVYADGGTPVQVQTRRSSDTDAAVFHLAISGYLVDQP